MERLARSRDPRIVQVMASLAAEYDVVMVARADGTRAADVRPLVRVSITVIAESNGRREIGSGGGGGRFGLNYFQDDVLARYVDQAVQRRADQPRVAPGTGRRNDRRARPRLARRAAARERWATAWRATSTARARRLSRAASASAWRAKGVTVLDDGTLPDRRGSLNVDDEGHATQRNVLIEDGILKGYIQDAMNARLMKVKPTGNGRRESYAHVPMPRMTNTYMLGGDKTERRDRRQPRARPVRHQLRRRPGRHHQRQVRLLGQRGVLGRERPHPVPGEGRHADRQRPRRADPHQHDRQRHVARHRRRCLRQGRPERCRWASASRRCASTA